MFRYFGPPGTGKTTTLLNHVEKLLSDGTAPNQIGYFAFTRKAAHEARDRAVARFNLDPDKDFVFFRTLHSLAFQLLGISGAEVLKETHLKEFSGIVGVNLTESVTALEDEGFLTFRSNHPIMRAIDLARTTEHGPVWAYNQMDLNVTSYHFKHIFSEYEKFKKQDGLKDFTDMLVGLSENEALIPKLKVVFLDEAQDLTPLQWRVASLLDKKCERMYVAGDDDQGIFGWAGADINRFIGLEGASEVLTQSYRVPISVWNVADRVSSRIRRRQKKEWSPRDAQGSVRFVHDHYRIDFDNQWLILAQANYMLNDIGAYLKTQGYFFERFNSPSLSKKVRNAIASWTHLTTGHNREISLSEAQNLYAHISSEDGRLQRGAKTRLKAANDQDVFTLGLLHEHFGIRGHRNVEPSARPDYIRGPRLCLDADQTRRRSQRQTTNKAVHDPRRKRWRGGQRLSHARPVGQSSGRNGKEPRRWLPCAVHRNHAHQRKPSLENAGGLAKRMAAMTDLISPAHYRHARVETIDTIMDIVRDLPGDEAVLVGNALKYLYRYRLKYGVSPIQDVQKAEWYIQKLIAILKTKPSARLNNKE